ncbi:hypothetical protein [Streptomyces murinus]|uniref:hypothetical protein n=1 Tax=Streptomyces murinus TaxID=33900 RepID=UPI003F47528B
MIKLDVRKLMTESTSLQDRTEADAAVDFPVFRVPRRQDVSKIEILDGDAELVEFLLWVKRRHYTPFL